MAKKQQTPLHYACRYGASIDIVRILTNANRELLKEEDSTGRLPLHVALRNRCSQSVVNWIVRKDPTACSCLVGIIGVVDTVGML